MCAVIDRHNELVKEGEVKILDEASTYSLRHARISELLQVHGIDPITVASKTRTSVTMLEMTYFKSIPPLLTDRSLP